MRNRIAPSSRYAVPSSTSRSAAARDSAARSSWYVTSPSQSIPSQRSESWICSTACSTSRPVSVFSMRRRSSASWPLAYSQLKRKVRASPMCSQPVGLGAMRRTPLMRLYGRAVLVGAHVSGGIRGAVERGRAIGADAVQLFVQSPRAWRFPEWEPAVLEGFGEERRRAKLGAAVVHAIYLVNLASPDDALYEKSVSTMRSTVDTACAIGADAVVFHVGSHLGAGLEAGLERAVPALEQVLERCGDDTWLLMENSAGAGGTIGRTI